MYNGTPSKVTILFLITIYSVCNVINIVVRMFPARDFAAPSFASRMSHTAHTLFLILRLFRDSSMVSLLKPISFRDFISGVNWEMVLVLIASKREVTLVIRNNFLI